MYDEFDLVVGVDEYLFCVMVVGFCGFDVYWYKEVGIGDIWLDWFFVIGYEFVGVIDVGD